jgi:hypothetical protein
VQGRGSFERRQRHLSQLFGLTQRRANKTSNACGIGGKAVAAGVALGPCGIAGINGLLETVVVEQEVPALLPVGLLEKLGASVGLAKESIHFLAFNASVDVQRPRSGHRTISILDFPPAGFAVPLEVTARWPHLRPESFSLPGAGASCPRESYEVQ